MKQGVDFCEKTSLQAENSQIFSFQGVDVDVVKTSRRIVDEASRRIVDEVSRRIVDGVGTKIREKRSKTKREAKASPFCI